MLGNTFHLSSSILTLILSTTNYTIFGEFIHHRTLMCCVADLQSAARRDRGAGRGAGGPQDHRDQRAERGGRAAREDRQPPRYLRGRGQ